MPFARRIAYVTALALSGLGSLPAEAYIGRSLSLTEVNSNPATVPHVEIAHASELNPTAAITIEAWVRIADTSCASIVGKGFATSYWLGICGTTLRSYLKGSGSSFDGGTVPKGVWTHVAVTFDGAARRHFINGVEAGVQPLAGPLPTNTQPLEIGSDANWAYSPAGWIDEVRLWSVARTAAELTQLALVGVTNSLPGLVAVYNFEDGAHEALDTHHGTLVNGAVVDAAPMDLRAGRFSVEVTWETAGGLSGNGLPIPQTSDTGSFYFFSPSNYELIVKVLDGCGVNGRYWVFAGGLTNVATTITVHDHADDSERVYTNLQGTAFLPIQDTSAFSLCP
jgi:hypothetical protein